jgi:hypothetical protein
MALLDSPCERARLEGMTVGKLARGYEEIVGEPTRSRHKQYLVRRILWRVQARAEGDLSERAKRRAAEIADVADIRITGTFDQHSVAFASVTQQFNTGTPMGRLVLNVLLSFAQFERERIAERIREKIAAKRRRGEWAGGRPILGYDVDRTGPSPKLVVILNVLHQSPPESRSVSHKSPAHHELRSSF